MGQLSKLEIELLRIVSKDVDTKYELFKVSNISSATINLAVNRMLKLGLLKRKVSLSKREKPIEITDKGKLALRMLGDLDKVID
jgi:predicted transcriptional regulator